jgi:phage protein D
VKLSRPSAVLTLDGRELAPAAARLAWLRLSLGLGAAHDAAELAAGPGSPLAAASPGSRLAVALGEEGEEETVWTGEVTEVAATDGGTRLEGLAATVALSRERRSQTYLRQSAADIVRDLAASATLDRVQAPLRLESYSVDDRRSVWAHLLDLARLAGCDLSASPEGGVRLVPPRRVGAVPLRYGADLLAWRVAAAAAPEAAKTAALGAASEQGAKRWHWLRRDPVPSPGAAPTLVLGALRTRDAADGASRALADRADRAAVRGEVVLVGRPALRPGDLVELHGLPEEPAPGTLRVLAVEHRLDGRAGFVTALTVQGAS